MSLRLRHWGDYCRGLFFFSLTTTYAEAEIVLRCAICIGNSDCYLAEEASPGSELQYDRRVIFQIRPVSMSSIIL